MLQDKRYVFTFAFTFDGKVEDRFMTDLVPLNETKLQRLGYEIDRSKTDGDKWLYACMENGQLPNFGVVAKVTHEELLHYQLKKVTVRLKNTLLPDPEQKQEKLGKFKYRNGDWMEKYMETCYGFHANAEARIVTVTADLQPGQNLKDWGNNLLCVLKAAQHSAFLASRVKELSYAMTGTDKAHMIAAQGKLMAAIAFKLV